MARNTPLGTVLAMVKAECNKSLNTTATAQDNQIYQIISDVQQWASSEYDWPFLKSRWDVAVNPGSRYLPFPTVDDVGLTTAINFERAGNLHCYIKWNQVWQEVEYGIDEMPEFNYLDSDRNQLLDPVQRWQFDDEGQFEIWPMNAGPQTLRFVGQRVLTELRSYTTATSGTLVIGNYYTITNAKAGDVFTNVGASSNVTGTVFIATGTTPTTWTNGSTLVGYSVPPVWNPAAELDLDDLLVSYFASAELLTREEQTETARSLLAMAQNRMQLIRATYPTREQPATIIGGTSKFDRRTLRVVPMVVVAGR